MRVMLAYVFLSTLTPEGRKSVKECSSRMSEVNRETVRCGAKVVSQLVVKGGQTCWQYWKLRDNEAVARVSAELGSRGNVQIRSMPAMSGEGFKS